MSAGVYPLSVVKLAKTVIVAGDAHLAEAVCSRLRRPGIYLPVLEAPMVRLVEYGVLRNDCARVANIVRGLKPTILLFLKLQSEVLSQLRSLSSELNPILLDDFDERALARILRLNPRPSHYKEYITSSPAELDCDIFAIEGPFGIQHVIAGNLAVAHHGRIFEMPETSSDEVDLLKDEFHLWSNGSSEEQRKAKDSVLGFLGSRVPTELIHATRPQSLSFITKGAPYGILPFRCPTTHFFSFPLLGVSVLAGMLKSEDHLRCPIAVLIDPNTVGESEFSHLWNTFGKAGYHVRSAYGEQASAQAATYLCEYLPSDFIFFSTHCGEVTGRRITERFPARDGTEHVICFNMAISAYRAPGTELIEVVELHSPISIDEVNWSDDIGKKRIRAGDLWADFLQHRKTCPVEELQVVTTSDSGVIKGSDALKMSDSNVFPVAQAVGGYHHPVVFNNACSSWRSFAMAFGCGGASVYVGTATLVLNSVAVSVACAFVEAVTTGKSIGPALFRAQRHFTEQFNYTPYLTLGYLYTRIGNPTPKLGPSRVVQRLASVIAINQQVAGSTATTSAIAFLKQELAAIMTMLQRNR